MTDQITIYPDRKGEWRWRLTAPNGQIIADSGEGYDSKGNARRAATRLFGKDMQMTEQDVDVTINPIPDPPIDPPDPPAEPDDDDQEDQEDEA